MSKNSLPTTARAQLNEQSLTGLDRVVSYLGWHALELLGIGGIAVLAAILGAWVWLLAIVPVAYGAWHDVELHRNNQRVQRLAATAAAAAPAAAVEPAGEDVDEDQDDDVDGEDGVVVPAPVDLDALTGRGEVSA